jgi:hypothetical protein
MTIRPAYIKTSSGWVQIGDGNQTDLDGLFDVTISSPLDNEALVYNSSASIWNNANIVNSLYGTGSQIDVSANNGDITLSLPNSLITPGDLEVTGNLTVSGSTTYINTQTLNVEDNIITLNSNVTGAPTGTAGIEVERGTEDNRSILWSEYDQSWNFDGDIRTYEIRSTDVFDITVSSSGSANGMINISTDNAYIEIDDIKRVVINADGDSYKFAKDFIEFPDLSHQSTAFLGMSSYDTDDLDEGSTNLYFTNERAVDALDSTLSNYLLNSSASSTYLTQTNATNTYLTQSSASTTYLTQTSASTNYLTKSSASTTYQPIGSYLTSETDPVFTSSDAYGIDSTDISNWNTSYGWGNHASAGYAASSHNHTLDSLSNVDINSLADGDAIIWSSASSAWINKVAEGGATTTVSETAPATPLTGDSWYKPSTGSFFIYDGSYWVEVTSVITMSDEEAQDKVAPLFNHSSHINMSASYDDANNKIILSAGSADTLSSVTDRGATTPDAISITNSTVSSSPITGALVVTGGVGIGEDLYVDNDVYIGGNINVTGTISGSVTYLDVVDLVVTDPLIYLADSNPSDIVDIGIFGAYNHSASINYHTGLIRDASDSGKWKLASNLLDPTSNVIDFTGATFDTLKIGALEVTNASTTRTNLGLAIGTDVQAYNATLAAVAGGTYSGDDSITTVGTISSGTWSGTTIGYTKGGTGLTTLGTAGQVLKVNAGATGIEWGNASGGSSFTDSAGLASILSDETGSGSVVFSTSPTFTTSIIGSSTFSAFTTTNNLTIGKITGSAGTSNILSGGTVAGGTAQTSGTRTDNYSVLEIDDLENAAANVIHNINIGTGGISSVGGATRNINIGNGSGNVNINDYIYGTSATFSNAVNAVSLSVNGQTLTQGSTGTASAVSNFDTTVYSSAEFIIYGSTSTGNYVSKVLMLARGSATPVITEYAILTQGTAPTVTITPSYSAPYARLTVGVASGTNIEIIATRVSI